MDAEDLLEYIRKNPLPPFNNGCAKKALDSFLWHFRLVGMYHEHRKYEEWYARHKLKNDWKEEKESPIHLISYSNQNLMTQCDLNFDSVGATEKSSAKACLLDSFSEGRLFNQSKVNTDITGNNKATGKDLKKKDLKPPETAEIFEVDETNVDTLSNQLANNGSVVTRRLSPGQRTACSESFLSKCGMIQKYDTQDIVKSLGLKIEKPNSVKDTTLRKDKQKPEKCPWWRVIWSDRTYAFLVLLLMWGYFLRCILYIVKDHGIPVMVILNAFSWLFMCCFTTTAMFVSNARSDHLYEFFTKWAALFQDRVTNSLGIRGVTSRKYLRIAIAIQWTFTFINVASLTFIMVMEDSFSGGMNLSFYITGYRSTWVVVVSSLVSFFFSFGWTAPVSFIIIICRHITTHFWEFDQVMKLHIAAAKTGFPKQFNLLRERHLAMCETVGVLDRYVRVTMSAFSCVSVLVACLGLYQLINYSLDTSVMIIIIFWMVSSIGLLGLITYHLANVNIAMHSVSDDLYTIQTQNVTLEQLGQLNLFLAKVNGPSMGFSILGMIVVTRELMLTLFSLFITYAVVLLQFK